MNQKQRNSLQNILKLVQDLKLGLLSSEEDKKNGAAKEALLVEIGAITAAEAAVGRSADEGSAATVMQPLPEGRGFRGPSRDHFLFHWVRYFREPSAGCHRAFLGGVDCASLLRVQFYALADASGAQRRTAFQGAAPRLGYRRSAVRSVTPRQGGVSAPESR